MPFLSEILRTVPSVLCEWITLIDAVHLPIVYLVENTYLEDGLPPRDFGLGLGQQRIKW
jgi:hypothetical protein